jgi:hypothetical protein
VKNRWQIVLLEVWNLIEKLLIVYLTRLILDDHVIVRDARVYTLSLLLVIKECTLGSSVMLVYYLTPVAVIFF